jgi:hypothetical protein
MPDNEEVFRKVMERLTKWRLHNIQLLHLPKKLKYTGILEYTETKLLISFGG